MQSTGPLKKVLATNANTSAFTAKLPTLTKPSGNLILPLGAENMGRVSSRALLVPYGVGSNNDAFSMRVWGWRHAGDRDALLWIPTLLGVFTCTISSTVIGVANGYLSATDFLADTVALLTDNIVSEPTKRGADTNGAVYRGSIRIFPGVSDAAAGWIEMPLHGSEMLEFDFDQTTGTPTMNVLCALME